jgi:hypothetical protein
VAAFGAGRRTQAAAPRQDSQHFHQAGHLIARVEHTCLAPVANAVSARGSRTTTATCTPQGVPGAAASTRSNPATANTIVSIRNCRTQPSRCSTSWRAHAADSETHRHRGVRWRRRQGEKRQAERGLARSPPTSSSRRARRPQRARTQASWTSWLQAVGSLQLSIGDRLLFSSRSCFCCEAAKLC